MFLILLLTTFTAFSIVWHYRKVQKLPPGPISIPLIGNLVQIGYQLWKQGGVVNMLGYFRKTYGNVFTLWVGPIAHVNVTDADLCHEMFVKNGHKYADRYTSPIIDYFRDGRGILSTNGEAWQEIRRFTLLTLRNLGVGRERMEKLLLQELDFRCKQLDSHAINGVTTHGATEFANLLVGSVINTLLVGKRFDDSNSHEFLKMKLLFEENVKEFSPLALVLPIWVLKYVLPHKLQKFGEVNRRVLDQVGKEAEQRIKDVESGKYVIDSGNPQDYVDWFILKMQTEKDSPIYNLESLKINLLDLWFAGQDTTVVTLAHSLNLFLNHPDIAQQVRDEADRVTNNGERPLSLQDRAETPYLNATINEIQRHVSVLNVNFWRVNHELTHLGGHPIDSGTLVCAQLCAIQKNEQYFATPQKFDPTRFLRDEQLAKKVMPFGIGKRACAGEALAKSELYLFIGNLLMRYNIEAAGAIPDLKDHLPQSAMRRPAKTDIKFIKRVRN